MQINYNLLKISYLQTGRTAVGYQSSTAQDKKSTPMLITKIGILLNTVGNIKFTGTQAAETSSSPMLEIIC